ncbi:sorting-associated protein 32 homolog [Seminavis robusta]|uniref:Sorting-associated protein 32 homolog n=1 Tax=Seminavis robusta TaxID=568900 RepID=A0A9N8HWJ3_9STRA|nr:sorting-associated protein 32 homolog [Seminavis robusta]|eukprot:Sro2675_g334390.1 sorting-associated protein 32 homolog (229) ;mRNA; r:9685-10625
MFNFFGKKKAEPTTVSSTPTTTTTDSQTTIVKLRTAIKNQEKREDHILKKVEAQVAEAKAKMAKGDKKGALFAMKRKKMYEQEVDKIQNVKMTLETQVINLESAAQNAATFDAMKSGTNTMKKIRNEVGIEKVDDIMDEMKEEMELAQEVNDAIAQPVDPLFADEDELLAELEGLETADLEAELLKPPAKPVEDLSLPSVPASKLPQPKLANDEADELKKLEAELAGL